jgi:hypothetical protein
MKRSAGLPFRLLMPIFHFQQGKDDKGDKGDGQGDPKEKEDKENKEDKDKSPKNRRRTERLNGRAATPRTRGVKGF